MNLFLEFNVKALKSSFATVIFLFIHISFLYLFFSNSETERKLELWESNWKRNWFNSFFIKFKYRLQNVWFSAIIFFFLPYLLSLFLSLYDLLTIYHRQFFSKAQMWCKISVIKAKQTFYAIFLLFYCIFSEMLKYDHLNE